MIHSTWVRIKTMADSQEGWSPETVVSIASALLLGLVLYRYFGVGWALIGAVAAYFVAGPAYEHFKKSSN